MQMKMVGKCCFSWEGKFNGRTERTRGKSGKWDFKFLFFSSACWIFRRQFYNIPRTAKKVLNTRWIMTMKFMNYQIFACWSWKRKQKYLDKIYALVFHPQIVSFSFSLPQSKWNLLTIDNHFLWIFMLEFPQDFYVLFEDNSYKSWQWIITLMDFFPPHVDFIFHVRRHK